MPECFPGRKGNSVAGISLNWHNLRSLQGSQHHAFEEVCAQLAAVESPAPGSVFVRKGAPDAGVEFYWRLTTGDEWAWQAKFFMSMGDAQWQQLDDSVATALDKHPRIVRYVVCVPLDFPDPRIVGKTHAMDRWHEHVQKWNGWACDRGMSVEFTYWGQHELFNRLLQDEHRGLLRYYFDRQIFSKEWFDQRLEEAIANADQRYLPKLNVDLAIQDIFQGLGRTPEFFDALKTMQGKVRRAYQSLSRTTLDAVARDAAAQLADQTTACLQVLEHLTADMQPLPLAGIQERAQTVARCAHKMLALLWEAEQRPDRRAAPAGQRGRSLDAERYYLGVLHQEARRLADFADSHEARLANTPALLLVGSAGMGKTHLLCHVARLRAALDRPTILILSEQLANGEPWSELLRVLQLPCDADEFLGALNAAGQARGSRVLIAIDALNEGEAQAMWERSLAAFLVRLARYPWVGVVVSVRMSYEETIIRKGRIETMLVRVEHRGFAGAEARAATHFFAHYGIVAPTIPPLHPEFSNPLFLRLFCQALQNLGYQQLPPGLHGLTSVFTFFLDSVNVKLARPEYMDVDPADRVVQRCVDRLAQAMADVQQQWLPRDSARALVASCHQRAGYAQSLFRQLLLEGVIAEDRFHTAPDVWTDGIRFTYQKFSDHLITRHLLNKHLDQSDPAACFLPGAPLASFVQDSSASWQHRGIVEALAIQLPEIVGRELPDLAPHAVSFMPVREAVIESIIWRDPGAFTESTRSYLNDWLLAYSDTFGLTMAALLTTATQVDHPYNARTLHRNLLLRPLADRDAWWSTFLHQEYIERDTNVITRLLDWCDIDEGKRDLSDESVLLAGMTVTWFFTSSNRFLRDHATKALVRLMAPRVDILASLVQAFLDIDDPYVLERLAAAAYGCVMRSEDVDAIHAVATVCYQAFFSGEPPVHMLLRDYARGIIERAVFLRRDPLLSHQRIAPPYGSTWPEKIPNGEELKALGYDAPGVHPAQRYLCFSVMEDDFARYIIGTNSWSFEWVNLPLRGTLPPSRRERTREFVASLTPAQRAEWKRFQRVFREDSRRFLLLLPELLALYRGAEPRNPAAAEAKLVRKDRRDSAKIAFCAVLSPKQQRIFKAHVVPFLQGGDRRFREEDRFDLRLLQGYILPRVFALGWTADRFGEFDREMRSRGRESHKAERIGKKYQWIAYYEVLARVADQFVFKGRSWPEQPVAFAGPWQVTGLRDIDPSMVLKVTAEESHRSPSACWWGPPPYQDWYAIRSHAAWVQADHDLLSLAPYVCVTDPSDGSRWLTLEARYSWEEPTPADREWSELSHRTLWYRLQAYIVRKQDADALFTWAQQQNFWGRWMPESHDFHEVFLGELFWSPAYGERFADARGERAWTRGDHSERFPTEVIVPAMVYSGVGTSRDCSMENPVHMYVPTPWVAEHLELRWAGVEGEFRGPDGTLITRDPSVSTPGPGALLVEESALCALLDKAGCEIIWTVLGCKEIVGAHPAVPGELQLNGAFMYRDGKVVGAIKGTFVAH
jgi:hypothetical protein